MQKERKDSQVIEKKLKEEKMKTIDTDIGETPDNIAQVLREIDESEGVTAADIEETRLAALDSLLGLGVNTLTRGGDFRATRALQLKETIVHSGALKLRRNVQGLLTQY